MGQQDKCGLTEDTDNWTPPGNRGGVPDAGDMFFSNFEPKVLI